MGGTNGRSSPSLPVLTMNCAPSHGQVVARNGDLSSAVGSRSTGAFACLSRSPQQPCWHGDCYSGAVSLDAPGTDATRNLVIQMVFRTRAGDRRSPRFEVVGSLSGTLMATQMLAVRNLSCGGALVQSPRPLIPNSKHTIELESAAGTVVLQARVVRATPSQGSAYAIAFEFVDLHPTALEQIQQMLSLEASGA